MWVRRIVWAVVGLVVAAAAALFIPGSPVHLAGFLGADGRSIEGHTLGHWQDELTKPDKDARLHAIKTIGAFGPDAEDAVPELARLMTDDPDDNVRVNAAVALVKLAPHTKPAVPALIAALTDKQLQVRFNAITALMRLRTDARAAVPALIASLKDPANDSNAHVFSCTVQEGAATALGHVSAGTADAVPTLTAVLTGDAKQPLKQAAARALGLIGEPARPAVPALYALLKLKDRNIREEATIALLALGEHIEPFHLTAEEIKADQLSRSGRGKGPPKGGAKGKAKGKAKDGPAKTP